MLALLLVLSLLLPINAYSHGRVLYRALQWGFTEHSQAGLGRDSSCIPWQEGSQPARPVGIQQFFLSLLGQFHHRDPGIVGLLTSDKIPAGRRVFYGMISDGIHTNPAALRIAHRAHPSGKPYQAHAVSPAW